MALIALADIVVDSEIQQRADGLNPETVNDYAEKYESLIELPPVVAFRDKAKTVWLADGFHRYAAKEQVGAESIDVDLREGTRRDAILFACSANTSHGLRRTNADKRKAIATLLSDSVWKKRSDHAIAETTGVHHTTVGTVRNQLANLASSHKGGTPAPSEPEPDGDGDEPSDSEPEARIGKDGKARKPPEKPKPKYPAWVTFSDYISNLIGIEDGLLAKYGRSVSAMLDSDDWDRARTAEAVSYLDEGEKALRRLRKEFEKHVES